MAKIHGIAYIIIGGGVAFAARMVNFESLKLFFYVGCILMIVGLFKLVFRGMQSNEDKKTEAKQQKHPNLRPVNRVQRQSHAGQNYKRCPRCYNVMNAGSNFCPVCGTRV